MRPRALAVVTPMRLVAVALALAGRRLGWMTVVLLVPFLGPPLYLLAGGSPIARSMRLFLVFGALGIYLRIATLSFLLQAL